MALRALKNVLRRNWLILLTGLLVGVMAGLALFATTAKSYASTCQVIVSVDGKNNLTDLNQGATYVERSIGTFAASATSPYVLEPVVDRLGLDMSASDLASAVSADVPTESTIIEVTATHEDPQRSADIANAVADQLVTAIRELSPGRETGGAAVTGTIIEKAEKPVVPSAPNKIRDLGLGGLTGLILASLVVLARESMDSRLNSGAKLRRGTDLPALAYLEPGQTVTVPLGDQLDPAARAIRQLHATVLAHTNLGRQKPYVLALASAGAHADSTRWAEPLAHSMSSSGLRTLLVTGNKERLSVPAAPRMDVVGLNLKNVDSLLANEFTSNLTSWGQDADVILIDAGVLGTSTLAVRAVQLATDSIIAVDIPRTTEGDLADALSLAGHQHANVIGLVVTGPKNLTDEIRNSHVAATAAELPNRATR